jgi:hypothetical protein
MRLCEERERATDEWRNSVGVGVGGGGVGGGDRRYGRASEEETTTTKRTNRGACCFVLQLLGKWEMRESRKELTPRVERNKAAASLKACADVGLEKTAR